MGDRDATLEFGSRVPWHLAREVPHSVRQRCRSESGKQLSDLTRLGDPRRNVGDRRQEVVEAALANLLEDPPPAALACSFEQVVKCGKSLQPWDGKAPGGQHWFAFAVRADPRRLRRYSRVCVDAGTLFDTGCLLVCAGPCRL